MFKEHIRGMAKHGITKDSAIYLLKNMLTSFRNHSEKYLISPLTQKKITLNDEQSKDQSNAKKIK